MARTAPLRALHQLAEEHAAARRLRIPVDDLRGLRAEAAADPSSPSRRELLRWAGAAGVTVAMAGSGVLLPTGRAHADTAVSPTKPAYRSARVAVIGAGISGLTAALTLNDAGVPCTVYEANPARIGGRMYSESSYWAGGQTSEYGGELIDTGHKKILELCRRFGLNTVDFAGAGPNGAADVLWFDNTYYPRAQADIDFKAVYQALHSDLTSAGAVTWNRTTPAGTALDNLSLYDWIETRVPGGHSSPLGRFMNVAYNVEYGADTQGQSSLALVLLMGYQPNPGSFNMWGLSNERYHIAGGNDLLPKAIAAQLPSGTVQMGWKLLAVRANSDGTQTLTFDQGGSTRTVTSDQTILTVPLPILQGLDTSRANFDPLMTNLLRDARMGYCTKLNMQFKQRTWDGAGPWPGVAEGSCFTDLPFQQIWDTTQGQPGSTGILIQYGGGSLAHDLNPSTPFPSDSSSYVRTLVSSVLTDVDKVFPGTQAQWNGKALLSAWHKNPYALGAYSCWPVGYLHRYAGYEGTRQGNIHIGGEHCSYDFQGYMNGGAVEGERAASETLSDLRI
ncbi:FAD-dependent oxidoreductase [Streptomyces sp. H10-C2]|uniref:flavin monoamine oxidase family protein n=1 Tax=unclassified Streptomyces TaxID=2593676 RepID=UPI0024B98E00|nr:MULTISPECIES: FAD-dependent oxidoreductase [unclassified Streptomyces]MDJ0344457.1 FAD-dependent oxidoreductase [Streptomyces sp. PH10-H1]MDJ0372067.1 FAD-dependent oxidoreductase [Streptomyces sp. H10-C2]